MLTIYNIPGDELVIGVGSAGAKIVSRMNVPISKLIIDKEEPEFCDTKVDNIIYLDPSEYIEDEKGCSLKLSKDTIDKMQCAYFGKKRIFLVAGLGGVTGSSLVEFIVNSADLLEIPVVGMFTLPFRFEARKREIRAKECMKNIDNKLFAKYEFSNDKLMEKVSRRDTMLELLKETDKKFEEIINLIVR